MFLSPRRTITRTSDQAKDILPLITKLEQMALALQPINEKDDREYQPGPRTLNYCRVVLQNYARRELNPSTNYALHQVLFVGVQQSGRP